MDYYSQNHVPMAQSLMGDSLKAVTIDSDDIQEVVNPGDLFYWPPGHNVIVTEDVEIIMFSPQNEHNIVLNHMIEKLKE